MIASDRHSDYTSGLDDDSFIDDFLSFPEVGSADQQSYELQFSGEYDKLDFVTGLYYFEEEGVNDQDPTVFNGGLGDFTLSQETQSTAIYVNVGYQLTDSFHVSAGVRSTEDEIDAGIIINTGLIDTTASDDWSETSWEIAGTFSLNDSMNIYGTVQSGYQSGQFPARPFCLFGFLDFTQPGNVSQPNCFVANENVTAINYETGIKGTPLNNLQMGVSIFYTEYTDLPYQVSTTTGGGFDTRSIIVDQTSFGVEWESLWAITDNFMLQTTLGYIDADVDDPSAQPGDSKAVAPLTPEITFSISPEYTVDLVNGADVVFRADYSFRDDMYGEPSSDSGRFTEIESRGILNVDIAYHSPDRDWTAAVYGRNVTDERYTNGFLNTGDYVLQILSNDIAEFGVRFTREF